MADLPAVGWHESQRYMEECGEKSGGGFLGLFLAAGVGYH
jgi:hypothetical protein